MVRVRQGSSKVASKSRGRNQENKGRKASPERSVDAISDAGRRARKKKRRSVSPERSDESLDRVAPFSAVSGKTQISRTGRSAPHSQKKSLSSVVQHLDSSRVERIALDVRGGEQIECSAVDRAFTQPPSAMVQNMGFYKGIAPLLLFEENFFRSGMLQLEARAKKRAEPVVGGVMTFFVSQCPVRLGLLFGLQTPSGTFASRKVCQGDCLLVPSGATYILRNISDVAIRLLFFLFDSGTASTDQHANLLLADTPHQNDTSLVTPAAPRPIP